MSHTAETDLATHVAGQLAGLTLGTNVYTRNLGPPEDGYATLAVSFVDVGGPAASPDNGSSKRQIPRQVMVTVRGEDNDATNYRAGKLLADNVYDEIEHAAVAGYINVRNLRPPTPIGVDAGNRPLWTWEVEMLYEES